MVIGFTIFTRFQQTLHYSAKRENIILRQKAGNGVWVSFLVPIAVLVSGWKLDGESWLYTSSRIYSFNLFLNVLHLLYHIVWNKSLYVTRKINILCAIPAFITLFLYINILHIDIKQSLLYSTANALIYFEGLPFILKVFPNSFTFGEANLVVQGLSLFLYASFTRLNKVIENVIPYNDYNISTTILQVGHLGMVMLCVVPFILSRMRSTLNMYIWVAIVIFGFITSTVNYMLPGNAFLWLWSFFTRKERLSVLALWLGCSLASVWILWNRIKLKEKADTILRKYFHILADIVFITGVVFDTNLIYFSSGCILAVFILIEIFRIMKIPPLYEFLQSSFLLYADEKDSGLVALTPIYLLIGYSIPLWLHPLTNYSSREKLQLLSGVLSVGIGDTCASIVGKSFGKYRWNGTNKTVEGTVACICGQVLFALAVVFLGNLSYSSFEYTKTFLAICIISIVEAVTDQIDNLVLPFISYILFMI